MGTADDIARLQQEIRDGLKQAGLSQASFATRYFDDTTENEREDDRKTFINTFNKQLKRIGKEETVRAQLQRYRDFLYALHEYRKTGLIPPRNVPYPELNEQSRRAMARISRKIDDALAKPTDEVDWDD